MVTGGATPGTAQLAATASSRGTREPRSQTTSSPLAVSTAVISSRRSGQSGAGRRARMTSSRSASGTVGADSAIAPTRARSSRGSWAPSASAAKALATFSTSKSTARSLEASGGSSCAASRRSRPTPLESWAATTDPAEVPTSRSAAPTGTPSASRACSTPSSQATPVTPPPPRTNARVTICRPAPWPRPSSWRQCFRPGEPTVKAGLAGGSARGRRAPGSSRAPPTAGAGAGARRPSLEELGAQPVLVDAELAGQPAGVAPEPRLLAEPLQGGGPGGGCRPVRVEQVAEGDAERAGEPSQGREGGVAAPVLEVGDVGHRQAGFQRDRGDRAAEQGPAVRRARPGARPGPGRACRRPGVGFLVAVQTLVQRRTPDPLVGRVSAAFLTAQTTATVAGAALAAALGQHAGLPVTLNLASAAVLVAAAAALRLLPASSLVQDRGSGIRSFYGGGEHGAGPGGVAAGDRRAGCVPGARDRCGRTH